MIAGFEYIKMKIYDNLNSEVSSTLNDPKGNYFPYRKKSKLSMNNGTMIEFENKFFIIERLEPAGSWLKLAFVVIDSQTQQVTRSNISLLKFNSAKGSRREQQIENVFIKDSLYNEVSYELSINPINPKVWYLLLGSKYDHRLFIQQYPANQTKVPNQLMFYEYSLREPLVRSVRWTPYSKDHLLILYEESLEVVNFMKNISSSQMEINLQKLCMASQVTFYPYVDIGFHESSQADLSVFSLFLFNSNKDIHVIKPFILTTVYLNQTKFREIVVAANAGKLGKKANDFIYQFATLETLQYQRQTSTGFLQITSPAGTFTNLLTLQDIKLIQPNSNTPHLSKDLLITRMEILKGNFKYPVFMLFEKYSTGDEASIYCFMYPSVMKLFLEKGLYAYQVEKICLTVNIPHHLARGVAEAPRIVRDLDEENRVYILSYNRVFRVDLTSVKRFIKEETEHIRMETQLFFQTEVGKNKDVDNNDAGFYGIIFNTNKICIVRMFSVGLVTFQAFPIITSSTSSHQGPQGIKAYLTQALKIKPSELPPPKPLSTSDAQFKLAPNKKTSQLLVRSLEEFIEKASHVVYSKRLTIEKLSGKLNEIREDAERKKYAKKEVEARFKAILDRNKEIEKKFEAKFSGKPNVEMNQQITRFKRDFQNIKDMKEERVDTDFEKDKTSYMNQLDNYLKKLGELEIQYKKLHS